MSSPTRIAAFILVLAPALLAGGCETTPLTAPQDGQIVLSAFPADVTLDPGATPPVDSADITITAQVFDSRGVALSGVEVIFSTTGGTLASAGPPGSAPTPVETNANGFALDQLTLTTSDPDSVDVTASSSVVSQVVTVTKRLAGNSSPVARISMFPADVQSVGQVVEFDGRGSSDADGDTITCFQWEIDSSENIVSPVGPCDPPDPTCELVQGPNLFTRTYTAQQSLDIVLRVSTDPTILCTLGGPIEAPSLFSAEQSVSYMICDDTQADAGPNQTVSLSATPTVCSSSKASCTVDADCDAIMAGDTCVPGAEVLLDGSGSAGAQTTINSFRWDCDNGLGIQDGTNCQGSGIAACMTCRYTTTGAPKIAELTVDDDSGCTDTDNVTVTVNP